MKPENENLPTVERAGNQVVINNPAAVAVILAIEKHNCLGTIKMQLERVDQLTARMKELGHGPDDVIIVIIHVDSWMGKEMAEVLMPGHDWQKYRDEGAKPFARGLCHRPSMQSILEKLDEDEAKKMKDLKGPVIWVQDHNVIAVYEYPLKEEARNE